MLATTCTEVEWRVLATHSIGQFPLHFPSRASPCAITFQLESTARQATDDNIMLCRKDAIGMSGNEGTNRDTQSEYWILTAFPRHQRLCQYALMLWCMSPAYLVKIFVWTCVIIKQIWYTCTYTHLRYDRFTFSWPALPHKKHIALTWKGSEPISPNPVLHTSSGS